MFDIKGIVAISMIVAAFGSGWLVKTWQYNSNELSRLETQIELQRKFDNAVFEIANQTQEAINNITIEHTTINRNALTEIREVPVYNECVIPTEGVRLINQARGHN